MNRDALLAPIWRGLAKVRLGKLYGSRFL